MHGTLRKPGEPQRKPGRPPGSKSRATIETQRRVAASGMSPLDYMLAVFRDTTLPDPLRLDAAKAAAPYVHPRLTSIEHSGAIGLRRADDMSDNELALIAAAQAKPISELPSVIEGHGGEEHSGQLVPIGGTQTARALGATAAALLSATDGTPSAQACNGLDTDDSAAEAD